MAQCPRLISLTLTNVVDGYGTVGDAFVSNDLYPWLVMIIADKIVATAIYVG